MVLIAMAVPLPLYEAIQPPAIGKCWVNKITRWAQDGCQNGYSPRIRYCSVQQPSFSIKHEQTGNNRIWGSQWIDIPEELAPNLHGWRVPPKRRFIFNGLHGVISHTIELFKLQLKYEWLKTWPTSLCAHIMVTCIMTRYSLQSRRL
jgi:hypothetical protein